MTLQAVVDNTNRCGREPSIFDINALGADVGSVVHDRLYAPWIDLYAGQVPDPVLTAIGEHANRLILDRATGLVDAGVPPRLAKVFVRAATRAASKRLVESYRPFLEPSDGR